jgi:hypothetical protein
MHLPNITNNMTSGYFYVFNLLLGEVCDFAACKWWSTDHPRSG